MAGRPKSEFTRTGVRRAGDDYQDGVALDLLVEWLEHPERYDVVRVEADDRGYLDDVTAESPSEITAIQVKFSAHPDDEDDQWDLARLLAERDGAPINGKRRTLPSLLAKWGQSVRALQATAQSKAIRARVVSNRRPSPQLKTCLDQDGRLRSERVSDAPMRDELIRQLGGDATAPDILETLRFELDHPGLEVLEEGTRRRFFRLGFDETGWLNLKDELRGWVRHRNEPPPNGAITLDVVRRAAGWNDPIGLPQEFPLPRDYVLPSEEFHQTIRNELTSGASCIVLTAAPGFGKSTYASYLYDELQREELPIVRHHYYLFQADRALHRLEHQVAAESLIHDLLRDYHDAVGSLATQQPDPSRLRDFLVACGKHYGQRGSRMVVLLDGLDHVWRERQSIEQLSQLLDHIVPVPPGVVLLVATQPVADEQLPRALLVAAPRDNWFWLPKLNEPAIETWLRHHIDELGVPGDQLPNDHQNERIAKAFFAIGDGHPLHLTYSFRALRERGIRIDESTILSLPACPTSEIADYYRALMMHLSQAARFLLHLFTSTRFSWPRSGLLDCLQRMGINRADAQASVLEVRHLLTMDTLGLRPFHSSLLAFVSQEVEYEDNADLLRRVTLEWLQTDAPPHWRWSYEWHLRADAGDLEPIKSGPDRGWAIEAVAMRRSSDVVESILSRSGSLTATPEDLPVSIHRGVTLSYFADIAESHRNVLERALFAQLILEEDKHLASRLAATLETLTDQELYLLAERGFRVGDTTVIDRCFEELRARVNNNRLKSSEHDPWEFRVAPVLAVAALAGNASSALRFSIADDKHRAATLVGHLVDQLLHSKQIEALRGLCREVLHLFGASNGAPPIGAPAALDPALAATMLLALEEGIDVDAFVNEQTIDYPLVAIYCVLRSKTQRPSDVRLPKLTLPTATYFDASQAAVLRNRFLDVFRRLLANHLLGKSDVNKDWLAHLAGEEWATAWFTRLDSAADACANDLRNRTPLKLSSVLRHFVDVPFPSWRTRADESPRQYAFVARQALSRIGLELIRLNPAIGYTAAISMDDLQEVHQHAFFEIRTWTGDYLNQRRRWLTSEARDFLLTTLRTQIEQTIEHFYERADTFAQMANIAAFHGRVEDAKEMLRRTAENLLSHGYHKDMLLFHSLDVVRLQDRIPTAEGATRRRVERNWLLQLAVPIASVSDFTDGDETNGLASELAEALGQVAPDLLARYHLWLTAEEEYDDATHSFRQLIEIVDVDHPIGAAVASTAVDSDARDALTRRAAAGDERASEITTQLDAYFGPAVPRRRRDDGTSNHVEMSEDQAVDPAAFDPARFADYLGALRARHLYSLSTHVETWLAFWAAKGAGTAAFEAVQLTLRRHSVHDIGDAMWRFARSLYGKDAAFEWLVRAQRETGWSKWFSRREQSAARWDTVVADYPERWFEFLRRSFEPNPESPSRRFQIGHFSWVRVVDYLITVNQPELAHRCVQAMILATMELVSAVSLPTPRWVAESTQ